MEDIYIEELDHDGDVLMIDVLMMQEEGDDGIIMGKIRIGNNDHHLQSSITIKISIYE